METLGEGNGGGEENKGEEKEKRKGEWKRRRGGKNNRRLGVEEGREERWFLVWVQEILIPAREEEERWIGGEETRS